MSRRPHAHRRPAAGRPFARFALLVPLVGATLLVGATPAPRVGPVAPAVQRTSFNAPLSITNPYFPLEPGRVMAYEGTSDGQPVLVVDEVLPETRRFVLGGAVVECVTQRETESTAGALSEISWNWYAQADDGTVHCFGEVVDVYEDGVLVSHAGSWLVGGPWVPDDPAETLVMGQPTVFMAAAPAVGDSWKPDDLWPLLDETVTVKTVGMRVHVPAGVFVGSMEVEETSDVDEDKPETKWYAPHVGLVKAKGRSGSLMLVSRQP